MEETGRLQSMGLLRVGHDWATSLSLFIFMHWGRKWQPTPVFLPGESQGLGEPGGLPSMGSHKVRHEWSDLATARLLIIFLPRSKRLLISWLQSPSAVILEPPKIKSDTVYTVSPSICHEVMGPDAMILVFWKLRCPMMKRTSFFGVSSRRSYRSSWTHSTSASLSLWLGHRLELLYCWMVCFGNELSSFCHFWDCTQVLHFRLFHWLWWLLHFF